MSHLTKCTQEEFGSFISDYPRPLKTKVNPMGDPWHIEYHDTTLGDWPKMVVAWKVDAKVFPNDEEYRILSSKEG